jgi:hypothetical protein
VLAVSIDNFRHLLINELVEKFQSRNRNKWWYIEYRILAQFLLSQIHFYGLCYWVVSTIQSTSCWINHSG